MQHSGGPNSFFSARRLGSAGTTLVEAVVATCLSVTILGCLFAAASQANKQLKGTREAVYSSQIVQNRLERVRSSDWHQINDAVYIRSNVLATSTLFAPALADLEETVTIEAYPPPAAPTPTPIKVHRSKTGTVEILTANNSLSLEQTVKVGVSTEWKSAITGAKRTQNTYTVVSQGGITH